jgi:hypothetical protein
MASKLAHNKPPFFFHKYSPAAQTSPELIFHITNMSQDSFLEQFEIAYSLSKICKIVREYTLKCSQLISRKSCSQPEMSDWIQATMQQNTKAELLQEGIFFLIHLFARDVLVMKKMEIVKTKPIFNISVLKVVT